MRCSLENKSMTKHEKRGRVLIHIPGAWSYLSEKQVTSTHSVNVCMFYSNILLRPSFGMFCKQQTLFFTHKSRTVTLRSGNLACKCRLRLLDNTCLQKYKIYFVFEETMKEKKRKRLEENGKKARHLACLIRRCRASCQNRE